MIKAALLLAAAIFSGCGKKTTATDLPVDKRADTVAVISGAKPVSKTNPQKVYVHYMAWFEDKTTSGTGTWGQHWTMANQNPDFVTADGKRQIASYFYPLTGPYASGDRDVIDYHLLLMKYAGIDGLIVDWYGIHEAADYPLIKRNTDSLFTRIPATGLQLGICYEDASLLRVKAALSTDTVQAVKEDFAYLASAYFNSSSYIKINNQPLLLCFGPQGMKVPANWQQAFSGLNPKPCFLSLQYHGNLAGSSANGEFSWVTAGNLTDMQRFYQTHPAAGGTQLAGAYPGFKDFYKQGGWGDNLFTIEHQNTTTLQNTLALAKSNGLPYLQLITWNDYGEGTMLEPTQQFQFAFLQTIQQYTGVNYGIAELQLIYKWYTLRKKYKGDETIQLKLTRAYNSLVRLDVAMATNIISDIN